MMPWSSPGVCRAVLSTRTFWTFLREFSPIELRADRIGEDTCVGLGMRSLQWTLKLVR